MRMVPGPATSRPSGGDQTPDAPLECWSCPRKDNNKNQAGDSQMLTGSHHSNFRFAGDLSGPPESASEALNSRIGDLSRIDSRFRLPQPPGSTLFGRSVCTLWLLPGTLVSAAPFALRIRRLILVWGCSLFPPPWLAYLQQLSHDSTKAGQWSCGFGQNSDRHDRLRPGHSSSEINRETYIHSLSADARQAVEDVEQLL